MSVPTVKTHLRHIFVKLEIDNRSQLVDRGRQQQALTATSSHIGEGHPARLPTSSLPRGIRPRHVARSRPDGRCSPTPTGRGWGA